MGYAAALAAALLGASFVAFLAAVWAHGDASGRLAGTGGVLLGFGVLTAFIAYAWEHGE